MPYGNSALRSTVEAVDPTATDDAASGYDVGSRWVNVLSDGEFVCCDATKGAAVWKSTTAQGGASGGGDLETTGQQRHGINITSASVASFDIAHNDGRGNVTAPFAFANLDRSKGTLRDTWPDDRSAIVATTVTPPWPTTAQVSHWYELTMNAAATIQLDLLPWEATKAGKAVSLRFVQGATGGEPTLVSGSRTIKRDGGSPSARHTGAPGHWDHIVVTRDANGSVPYAAMAGTSRP